MCEHVSMLWGNTMDVRPADTGCEPEIQELSYEEGFRLLDEEARRTLGITGEEFLKAWDEGRFGEGPENVAAEELAMLIPFARPVPLETR